jgi:lipopolysaccharide/colanic/teichoic acid biosynthesis glycosyltransferase
MRESPSVCAVIEPTSPGIFRVKAILDFGLALLLLIPALPVMAVAIVLIRLTSSGAAIYTQTRLGQGRRSYKIIKLRTMYHNCEAKSGITWSTKGDTRITPLGRILRATHIDELPQLFNVLKGEMSLVGPRPERPEIAARLAEVIPGYYERTAVKPGVTGLAQILLPPDSDLESVRRKLALDTAYVRRQTSWLDARLLFGTAFHVASLPPTWIRALLALPVERAILERSQHTASHVLGPVTIPAALTGPALTRNEAVLTS